MPRTTVKKTVKASKKPVKVKASKKPAKRARPNWNELTPAQQAKIRRAHKLALKNARQEMMAGGFSWLKRTKEGVDIYAANDELVLHITPKCVKNACRSSKEDCVIAKAIRAQQPFASGWQVGTNITMIYSKSENKVIRYGTSAKLSRALAHYDRTGVWNLEPGHYVLLPLPPAYRVGTRWAWYKGSGGKRSTFKGMARKSATRGGNYRSVIGKKKAA